MSEIMQIDEFVQLHDERFAAYRSVFVKHNPPPEYRAVTGVNWFSLGALTMLVIASVLVSGSRTVVEFGGGLFGLSAFLMLEVGMIFYAYWRALRSVPSEHEDRLLTNVGMFLAFGVSLSANIHAELRTQGTLMPDWVNTIIFLAMAISAPALALIAGDKLGRELVSAQAIRERGLRLHQEAVAAWNDRLNQNWDKNKARWGVSVRRLQTDDPPAIPLESAGIRAERLNPPESARKKVDDPEGAVRAHYALNPADLRIRGTAENTALAERIGVGKTLLYRVSVRNIGGGAIVTFLDLDAGGLTQITAKDVLEKRMITLGSSGTGKTNTVARAVEQLGKTMPFVVVDPHGEYFGLLEMFDALIIGRSEHVHLEVSTDSAGAMAEFVYDNGLYCILDLLFMRPAEREAFVLAFFTAFWARAQRNKKPYLIVVDEAHNFIPEGFHSDVKAVMKTLALEGRKFGLAIFLATQTTTELAKIVLKQCGIRILHAVFDSSDLKQYQARIPRLSNADIERIVIGLAVGDALFVDRDRVETVHILKRETFHASDTPEAEGNHALHLRTIDRALLEELRQRLTAPEPTAESAAPRGQVRHEDTELILSLRQQIVTLRTELEAARRPKPAPESVPPQEKQHAPSISQFPPSKLGTGETRLLTTLIAVRKPLLSRSALALLSGYNAAGGYFRTTINLLKEHGYIVEDMQRETLALCDLLPAELSQAIVPLVRANVYARWEGKLNKVEEAMLRILIDSWPDYVKRSEIARTLNKAETGGYFRTCVKKLLQNGLALELPAGLIAADAWFLVEE